MAGANSIRTIFFALGANFSIAIAKLVAAIITGSGAMMAESIHSFADTGNQLLLLFGMRQSKRPATDEHPLGYGKSIYWWSFLVALMLFSMGGMYSLYEGWHKLQHPESLSAPWVAIGVLIFGIIAESVSMWGCLREVNKVRHGRSYLRWFKQSRQSELLVIFGEDLAALLGLVFALIAIFATMVTGNPIYDAIGTLLIGALLIFIAIAIAVEVKALIIGQGVEPDERQRMLDFLEQQPAIAEVYNLRTLQLGNEVMAAIKARLQPTGSEEAMIKAINQCEMAFSQAFPHVTWLFFEPDNED
ncbi:MAG: cation diffusion facilitator family transporter [Wenzhouxiangellaceae bacterium]